MPQPVRTSMVKSTKTLSNFQRWQKDCEEICKVLNHEKQGNDIVGVREVDCFTGCTG